jgi:ABC-type transport system substrate-binding protein
MPEANREQAMDAVRALRIRELKLRRRDVLGMIGGAAASLTAGASGVSAQNQPKRGGVLKIAAPTNPTSLDPYTGGGGLDHQFLFNIFDTLIEWDYETLKPKPGLAESWHFSDPHTLVLNIRPNVVFHDGTHCDAEAVRWNLDRGKRDVRSNVKADFTTVASTEVTGPSQVTLKLNQPDSALPLILSDRAGMMASPKAVETLGKEHDRKPVGTGAHSFVSWADGNRIVLKRNEIYWKPQLPYLDGIEFAIITEIGTAVRSVLAGENDYVYFMSPQQKPLLERAKNLNSVSASTIYCLLIYFNYAHPPFDDVRVRRAINFAINREEFVKLSLGGMAETATMLLPSSHWAYDATAAKLYPHDPDMARKLLAEAGFKDGLDINLLSYSDQTYVQRQEVLIEQFKKSGIRLRFSNNVGSSANATFFGERKGDGMLSAWTGRPDPSLSYALMFLKDAYYNPGRVEVLAEITQLIADSRASEDLEIRRAALANVQRLVMEQALCAPLAFQPELDAFNKKVRGYRPNLLGKPKFEEIYLQE